MDNYLEWSKLAKYFANECTPEERLEIEKWISQSSDNLNSFNELRKIWETTGTTETKWDAEHAWKSLERKISSETTSGDFKQISVTKKTKNQALFPYPMWKIAAIIVMVIGIGTLFFMWRLEQKNEQKDATQKEIIADKGQRVKFRFEDGTKVTLNAASVLRFPNQFNDKIREVFLSGEAFFEVAPNKERPFIVRTIGASVEVLGTEFNVKSWPTDQQIQVVVAQGRVAFKSERSGVERNVILTRGQMSELSQNGIFTAPALVNIEKETAWVDGSLIFENTLFSEALRSIERRYNIVCLTADSTMLSRRLTASFKDESVSDVLKLISLSLDLRYRRNQDTVIFYASRRKNIN